MDSKKSWLTRYWWVVLLLIAFIIIGLWYFSSRSLDMRGSRSYFRSYESYERPSNWEGTEEEWREEVSRREIANQELYMKNLALARTSAWQDTGKVFSQHVQKKVYEWKRGGSSRGEIIDYLKLICSKQDGSYNKFWNDSYDELLEEYLGADWKGAAQRWVTISPKYAAAEYNTMPSSNWQAYIIPD